MSNALHKINIGFHVEVLQSQVLFQVLEQWRHLIFLSVDSTVGGNSKFLKSLIIPPQLIVAEGHFHFIQNLWEKAFPLNSNETDFSQFHLAFITFTKVTDPSVCFLFFTICYFDKVAKYEKNVVATLSPVPSISPHLPIPICVSSPLFIPLHL